MAFIRTVKVKTSSGKSEEYGRIVESYRDKGRQKQQGIAYLENKISGSQRLWSRAYDVSNTLLGAYRGRERINKIFSCGASTV